MKTPGLALASTPLPMLLFLLLLLLSPTATLKTMISNISISSPRKQQPNQLHITEPNGPNKRRRKIIHLEPGRLSKRADIVIQGMRRTGTIGFLEVAAHAARK